MRWRRSVELFPLGDESGEVWTATENDRELASFPVWVRRGKPFDVLRAKTTNVSDLRAAAKAGHAAIDALYGDEGELVVPDACPACAAPVRADDPSIRIHRAAYRRCGSCGHLHVSPRPSEAALVAGFRDVDEYAGDYTDAAGIEWRLREIIAPKLQWVVDVYRRRFGRPPRSMLDVGAGGGHFVLGARRAGYEADGVEVNRAAARFARERLGVELSSGDFLSMPAERRYDVVTFWGVLEYAPRPLAFLERLGAFLTEGEGLAVVEVPGADSVSTAIQSAFPNEIWRHLMPSSHMNVFSPAGLATLSHRAGLGPIALWTFGMDAYELLTRLALIRDDDELVRAAAAAVPTLQAAFDRADAVDDLVMAVTPFPVKR